jgi:hypothetical protein
MHHQNNNLFMPGQAGFFPASEGVSSRGGRMFTERDMTAGLSAVLKKYGLL